MREHLRSLIEQARQEAGSRMNGPDAENTTTMTDRLGADAVRLARLATALHMSEAAQCESRAMNDRRDSESDASPRLSASGLPNRRHLHHPKVDRREPNTECRLAMNERERER